jgi:hypothetical protein
VVHTDILRGPGVDIEGKGMGHVEVEIHMGMDLLEVDDTY